MPRRRYIARLLRLRRLPAVIAAGLLVLALAPAAITAVSSGSGGVTAPRTVHLPPELARLHAEALQDAPAGVTTHDGGQADTVKLVSQVVASTAPTETVSSPFALGGNHRLFVGWTPPSDITAGFNYEVTAYDVASPGVPAGACTISSMTNYSPTRNCSVTGLLNAHQYTATVALCDTTGACGPSVSITATTAARWPDPVSSLTVTGGSNSITASWSPPSYNGGLAVDHYVAYLFTGTQFSWCYSTPVASADVSNTGVTFSAATAALYNGSPANGTYYHVTVFAINDTIDGFDTGNADCSPGGGTSQAVDSTDAYAAPTSDGQIPEAGQYTPVGPDSLLGSAGTTFGSAGGTVVPLVLGRSSDIPSSGVSAVTVAVSATGTPAGGGVFVWNTDAAQPARPIMQTNTTGAATTVTVPIGPSGEVSIHSTVTGTVQADLLGYFSDATTMTAGSRYVGVSPYLVYNSTMSSTSPVQLNGEAGFSGVRPDAASLEVELQVSGATAAGSLTLEKTAGTASDAPALYYAPGQTSSVVSVVPLDSSGHYLAQLSNGSATVKVTAIGYYSGPFDPSGSNFVSSSQVPVTSSSVTAGSSVTVPLPANAPSVGTIATQWLLIQASNVTGAGTLSVYPSGNSSAAVQVGVSPGVNSAYIIPVPRTAANGSSVIASDTAAGSVTVDVAGYTILGTTAAAPSNAYAAPIAGGAYLTWFAPCSDGGSPVSTYKIVASPGGASLTVDATQTSAFFYGLTDGTSYSFEIMAVNSAGAGPATPWTPAVTPEPTMPDPPDQPGAQAADSSALVSWDTPAHTGDSPITGYTISAPGISQAVSGGSTHQVVITGLTNGTAYTFQVTATNALGTSQPSVTSISVTPTAGTPIATAFLHPSGGKPIGPVKPVTACRPLSVLYNSPSATSADTGTTAQYQLDGHIIAVTTPPADLDIGAASLSTLHKWHYAMDITTTSALRAWQRGVGHSHAVPVVPCVMAGSAPSSAGVQAAAQSCVAAVMGTSGPTPGGANAFGNIDNPIWTGILANAHSLPKPLPAARMDTGDPFEEVMGTWQQTTNSADPGGTNLLSSWVGIGGWGIDSHDQLHKGELIQAGFDEQTNNTQTPWWEILSYENGVPAIHLSGFSASRTDVFRTEVVVNDPDKAFPASPRSQADFNAGVDNSSATFTWFDFTNGENATFTVYQVYTDYDGRMAEWINEPPIQGSQLAALPQFAPIKWLQASATAAYNAPYLDFGTPYYWNWDRINVTGNGTCVAGPTGISMASDSATWNMTWHPNTC